MTICRVKLEVKQLLNEIIVTYDALKLQWSTRQLLWNEIILYKRMFQYRGYKFVFVPCIEEVVFNDDEKLVKTCKLYTFMLQQEDVEDVLDPSEADTMS
jgi:hypothetical protein